MSIRIACQLIMVLACVPVIAGCSQAQQADHNETQTHPGFPRTYTCFHTTGLMTIDGRLDDAGWKPIPWTEDFIDIRGPEANTPRYRTRVKMAWDDEYLYIAGELEEPHVIAAMTKPDSLLYRENNFEVLIDPNDDGSNYYEIEINALETIFDLFLVETYHNGGPPISLWECRGLKKAVHINGSLNDPSDIDTGWSVEMAIPWPALAEAAGRATPPEEGDTWRLTFLRVEWQYSIKEDNLYVKRRDVREEYWVWTPQWKVDMHLPEYWGSVTFRTEDR